MAVKQETASRRQLDGTLARQPIGWKVVFKVDGAEYSYLDPRTGRTKVWPLHKREGRDSALEKNNGIMREGVKAHFAPQIAGRAARLAASSAPTPAPAEIVTIRAVWAMRKEAILVRRDNRPLAPGSKRQVENEMRDDGPIMKVLGDVSLTDLTRFHVEDFLAGLIRDHAATPRMIEHQAATLRRVLGYCERTKDFGMPYPLSPLIRVPKAKRQKEPNRFTPEDLVKLLLYCQEHRQYQGFIALLAFMYYRGGRVGEFTALRQTSFVEGRDRRWIYVDAEIDHESGALVPRVKTEDSERYIVICEDLWEFARRHTAAHRSLTVHPEGFASAQTLLFSMEAGRTGLPRLGVERGALVPRSYNSVRSVLRTVGTNAIGRPLRPHDFRHSFTTEFKARLLKVGLDRLVVQRILGHASSDITDEYDGSDPRFDPAYVEASEIIRARMREAGIGALLQ